MAGFQIGCADRDCVVPKRGNTLIPFDSFLLDPLLLYFTGILLVGITSRIVKWRWKNSIALLSLLTLAVFWGTSVSLFFDLEWTRWIWEMSGASSG